MNKQKWMMVILALGLMGGSAALLMRLKATQKLGEPAVKTRPIPADRKSVV